MSPEHGARLAHPQNQDPPRPRRISLGPCFPTPSSRNTPARVTSRTPAILSRVPRNRHLPSCLTGWVPDSTHQATRNGAPGPELSCNVDHRGEMEILHNCIMMIEPLEVLYAFQAQTISFADYPA